MRRLLLAIVLLVPSLANAQLITTEQKAQMRHEETQAAINDFRVETEQRLVQIEENQEKIVKVLDCLLAKMDGQEVEVKKVDNGKTVEITGNYPDSPAAGRYWYMNRGRATNPSRSTLVSHLLHAPAHAGKFSQEMLNKLSYHQLHVLHSDDHDGRVRWELLGGTQTVSTKQSPAVHVQKPVVRRIYYKSTCPSGNCPNFR